MAANESISTRAKRDNRKGNMHTTTNGAEALMLEAAILEGEMAKQTEQAKLLRDARDKLEVTSEQLAQLLGVSLPTLRNWLAPPTSKVHREMPLTAKLLLARILADQPRKRAG
jgi:DNA-binding transcriptional regulator YiaG